MSSRLGVSVLDGHKITSKFHQCLQSYNTHTHTHTHKHTEDSQTLLDIFSLPPLFPSLLNKNNSIT